MNPGKFAVEHVLYSVYTLIGHETGYLKSGNPKEGILYTHRYRT